MTRRIVASIVVVVLVIAAMGAALLGLGVIPRPTSATRAALGPPHFVEEALAAGIDHTYRGGDATFVGGGVAVLDCNGDGRPDLYIAGGDAPAALYRNDSPTGGALRFTSLPDPVTDAVSVVGAYPIDIDGDGVTDLAILRTDGATLLRGLGGCRFEPADARWAFDGGHGFATAFSATWEGSAVLPTIAVGNYLGIDAKGETTFTCTDDSLVRPNPSGSGYAPPVTLAPGYCALSMLFSDWDGSGRRDLRVSNDSHYYDQVLGEEQLWRVAPGEAPRLYTAADGWVQVQIEGMGIASYDVTGDGYPDVFLTSQAANRLQALTSGPGEPTYRDIGLKRGVNSVRPFMGDTTLPSTAWHPEFDDVNNDGLIDLLITKGNVGSVPDYAQKDASDLFIGQVDGTFLEGAGAAGVINLDKGRGAALADFNLDGLLDLVLVNMDAPVRLWRNVGSGDAGSPAQMGGWLGLELSEPGPNPDAIGAWIETRVGDQTQRREVTIGGGHLSGELGWIHVGLGTAASADIRVQWPDGTLGPWQTVSANRFVTIARGSDPQPWAPPTS
jgi:hypothetical protein